MGLDFKFIKQSPSKKRKMMLWTSEVLIARVEAIKPAEITLQEGIRQLLEYALDRLEEEGSTDVLIGD